MSNQISIEYSKGRGKYGQVYAYIRPAGKCSNRSRRVKTEQVQRTIEKHFPVVNYYLVDGLTIGAKDPDSALEEYWRICEYDKVGEPFEVSQIQTTIK